MDPNAFASAVEPVSIPVSQKYLDEVSHGNVLSSTMDPLSYGTYFTFLNNLTNNFVNQTS